MSLETKIKEPIVFRLSHYGGTILGGEKYEYLYEQGIIGEKAIREVNEAAYRISR